MRSGADVLIVGGGMVGLTMAALVADYCKVTLIDSKSHPLFSFQEAFSNRVSAVSKASESILRQANAWSLLSKERITPYQDMKVWDENGSESLHFSAQLVAEPNIGFIIENEHLRSAIFQRLKNHQNVNMLFEERCELMSQHSDHVECQLESGKTVRATLLVGADGGASQVRKSFNFTQTVKHYNQKAIVANVAVENEHQMTAWQRFLATGPIAFLPLPDPNLCSIVWSVNSDKADSFLAETQLVQNKLISAAYDYRLGRAELMSDPAAFPLVAQHAESYVQGRVVLMGDAAHTIHPLAGQGVNLGFKDAKVLADSIIHCKNNGVSLASKSHLRSYERARKADNHMVQKLMSMLNATYAQTNPLSVLLRNVGVSQVEKSNVLKRKLILEAMGL